MIRWLEQKSWLKICHLTTFYTDLKPDGKFQLVQELQKAGRTILMVGDGLNDSAP